jgi:predicted O-methyltransferase YrrM
MDAIAAAPEGEGVVTALRDLLPVRRRECSCDVCPSDTGARLRLVAAREASGPALATLAGLEQERVDPFDLVFIDADKPNNPRYFEWALRLALPGAIIIVDNVVRQGAVLDASGADESIEGAREVLRLMGRSPGVAGTVLQTVGSKGYDGFAIAVVGGSR